MMMAYRTILALLVLQIYAHAAPANTTETADAVQIENDKLHSQDQPSPVEESKDDSNATENQRQKRFYNHYGLGFPPISPVQYPTYNKRDQASDLGVYGIDDPLSQIHRQIQEIASLSRLPPPPPPVPVHYPVNPFYFPVIFVPQYCACGSNGPNTPKPRPDSTPTTKPPTDVETTTPDVTNRRPEMEDERQNWGFFVNETGGDDFGEDFSRPISFDPVVVDAATSRPAPPVEHGSNQAGSGNPMPSTTIRPSNNIPSNEIPRPGQPERPLPPIAAGAFASSGPYPPPRREQPTTCDGAVLSCCHQPQITYDCFAVLGCPDPTSYGNPCDPLVILKVIGKYQQFYGVTSG